MKVSEFVHEMQQTAAIFGRTTGTTVTFSGTGAYTDGKNINLPSMSLDKELTNEQVRLMRGYVDHEAGHHRHSDMPKIVDFYKRCINNDKKDLRDIHNCLEDVWMEQRVIDEYPGAWKNLKQANDTTKTMELNSFKENNALDMLKEVNSASIGSGIKAQNPQYLTPDSPSQQFLDHLTPEMQEWTKKWCDEALKCENSEQLITLAKSIYKLINDDPNFQENQKPEDFDPNSGEDMDVGEAGDTSEQEAMRWGKPGGKSGKPSNGKREWDPNHLPTIEEGISEDAHDSAGGGIGGSRGPLVGGYRVYSTASDIVYKRGMSNIKGASPEVVKVVNSTDITKYTEVRSKIGPNINVMSAKLRRALLAKQQRDWDYGRTSGRLDSKKLVKASRGFEAVYKKRIDRMEEDTAISILVDLSGSMWGQKAEVARDCALAIAECLDGSQMTFKITGFSNRSHAEGGTRSGQHHRYERLDTVVFKDYNDSMKRCKYSVAQLTDTVGGNNSDYDFITNEISELKRRPEKRKVLFVLSDGHPACTSDASTSEHVRHCNEAVKRAKKDGIECIGIGICDDTVKRIYPDHIVVHKIQDLSSTMFNKMTRMLV